VHGIYAADARLLSVRAAFPKLWELEEKGNGRVLWGVLRRSRQEKQEEKDKEEAERKRYQLGNVMKLMDGVSVYSFRDGIGTLADALSRSILKNPNVRILPGTEVTSLQFDDDGFEVRAHGCLLPVLIHKIARLQRTERTPSTPLTSSPPSRSRSSTK
jgi:oxygen-dependent protoporphyrinogen oxidase